VLVDGGLPQINAACESLSKLEMDIPVFGLYKNETHQTEGLMDEKGHKIDLQSNKPLFFLLMRMQDEVHRFAISFHHQVRSKAFKSSILDGIEGLGKRRIEILHRNYDSINDLKKATLKELEQLLPKDVALKVKAKLEQ